MREGSRAYPRTPLTPFVPPLTPRAGGGGAVTATGAAAAEANAFDSSVPPSPSLQLGLDAPAPMVDALFRKIDADGAGAVEYYELKNTLDKYALRDGISEMESPRGNPC